MSAQMEMMSIATRLKPGNEVLIPAEMVRDAVLAERTPSIFNLFDTQVDTYQTKEFLEKVSCNWEFKYKWEHNFYSGEEFLVMYKDPIPAHHKMAIEQTEPMGISVGSVPCEQTATYVSVEASPILRVRYRYYSKRCKQHSNHN